MKLTFKVGQGSSGLSLVTTSLTFELHAFLQLLCHFYRQVRKLPFIFNNSADISSLPREELIIFFQSILLFQLEQTPHSPPETMGSSGCNDCLLQALSARAENSVSTEWTPGIWLYFSWPILSFSIAYRVPLAPKRVFNILP